MLLYKMLLLKLSLKKCYKNINDKQNTKEPEPQKYVTFKHGHCLLCFVFYYKHQFIFIKKINENI